MNLNERKTGLTPSEGEEKKKERRERENKIFTKPIFSGYSVIVDEDIVRTKIKTRRRPLAVR